VISKILYLRQTYHFGPGKIADYLQVFTSFAGGLVGASHPRPARHEPSAGHRPHGALDGQTPTDPVRTAGGENENGNVTGVLGTYNGSSRERG
jgi:hypothetical protein